MVSLEYLSNFWRTLKKPLINCETDLISNWSGKYVLYNDTKATTFQFKISIQLKMMQSYCKN